jgi:hypothetical protein
MVSGGEFIEEFLKEAKVTSIEEFAFIGTTWVDNV